ncbi:DUF3300 domain-containing protein [Shewanella sp. JM162201]|uniref:DUF3300 domain-containing protein n=1 Tax=Shewanella jiangmenensis TaxID=2837387 RepID=A0ABS5V667_9GAMM|nr:DUF3300 domain-containing protein [Shewanella jiangmenensis]MBT1445385.1 DUF3300 domain-containing protein [Shewanella jiangmenensis]
MNRSIRIQLLSALICLPLFAGCTSVAKAEYPDDSEIRSERFSEAELARLLAPVALYPDTLLTHILIASSYPLEVVEASRWREKNRKLSPKKMMDKAEKQGWDPSVTALVAFPDVLERMSDDLDWTRDLGDAFLADEEDVLDTIQMLRREADRAGNLDGGENLVVKRQPTQIIIESPRPEVIYVPYYDPRVVYGRWRWHLYPPVYWAPFPGYVSYHRHFGWHSGISISFNFYFSNFHWYDRHVIVHHHHHYKRPPEPRYAISHGAQRWRHNPGHRRGVEYRSMDVRKRYHDHTPSRMERQHLHREEVARRSISSENGGLDRRDIQPRTISQAREQEFKARMNGNEHRSRDAGSREQGELRTRDKGDNRNEMRSEARNDARNDARNEARNDSRSRELNDSRSREQNEQRVRDERLDKANGGWRINEPKERDQARTRDQLQQSREREQPAVREQMREQQREQMRQPQREQMREPQREQRSQQPERDRGMSQERAQVRERQQSSERGMNHDRAAQRERQEPRERHEPRERQ